MEADKTREWRAGDTPRPRPGLIKHDADKITTNTCSHHSLEKTPEQQQVKMLQLIIFSQLPGKIISAVLIIKPGQGWWEDFSGGFSRLIISGRTTQKYLSSGLHF